MAVEKTILNLIAEIIRYLNFVSYIVQQEKVDGICRYLNSGREEEFEVGAAPSSKAGGAEAEAVVGTRVDKPVEE